MKFLQRGGKLNYVAYTDIPLCQVPQHLTAPGRDYADCSRAPGLHQEGEPLPVA